MQDPRLVRLSPPAIPERSPMQRTLPRVPDWVENPDRWVTLSRAERRQLERHHRKVTEGHG